MEPRQVPGGHCVQHMSVYEMRQTMDGTLLKQRKTRNVEVSTKLCLGSRKAVNSIDVLEQDVEVVERDGELAKDCAAVEKTCWSNRTR